MDGRTEHYMLQADLTDWTKKKKSDLVDYQNPELSKMIIGLP